MADSASRRGESESRRTRVGANTDVVFSGTLLVIGFVLSWGFLFNLIMIRMMSFSSTVAINPWFFIVAPL